MQIHVYFRSKHTLTETYISGKSCLKYPAKVYKMKRKGIFVPTQQVEPSLQTARSTAVCHARGILIPSYNQIQPDPAAQHTHDCLLGRRERVTVRLGLAIPRSVHQGQPCWQFGSGWFLDLPYRSDSDAHHTDIMSVLPGARARRSASLACAPVTLLYCGLLCCTLYDVS